MINDNGTEYMRDGIILERTLQILAPYKQEYERAINIGFGIGYYVTTHLPAKFIHDLDIAANSDTFRGTLPDNVAVVTEPDGKYDLVVSIGTLYDHFDHEWIYRLIMGCAKNYILIGGVDAWLIEKDFGSEIISYAYQCGAHEQRLTLYKIHNAIQ
jgi:hypothetical protein